jgi:hypothetical protein
LIRSVASYGHLHYLCAITVSLCIAFKMHVQNGATALEKALLGSRVEAAMVLVDAGARVDARRPVML